MDQLPRLGKRELICLLLVTCNYVVSVWRGFLFLWVLGMGYSLSLPYNYFVNLCCFLERYQANPNGSQCFIGYFYSLNFVKSKIIPSIKQFKMKTCLLFNQPQNMNLASKGYHMEVGVHLDAS